MRPVRERKGDVSMFGAAEEPPLIEPGEPFKRPLPPESIGVPFASLVPESERVPEREDGEERVLFTELTAGRTHEEVEQTRAEVSRQRRCRTRAANAVVAWQTSGDALIGLEDTSALSFKETLVGLALQHTDADSPVWDQLIESFVIHAVHEASLHAADERGTAPDLDLPDSERPASDAGKAASKDVADAGGGRVAKHKKNRR